MPLLLFISALDMAIAVALGAFGAHALQGRLNAEASHWWQTANHYQFIHGLGLLALSILLRHQPDFPKAQPIAGLLIGGSILFCGSLYLMALGAPRWFGAATPLGGFCFISAWLTLAWQAHAMGAR